MQTYKELIYNVLELNVQKRSGKELKEAHTLLLVSYTIFFLLEGHFSPLAPPAKRVGATVPPAPPPASACLDIVILICPHYAFLVLTSVLKHPEQVIDETKIEVQSYESWLANKKVNNFINSTQRLLQAEEVTFRFFMH